MYYINLFKINKLSFFLFIFITALFVSCTDTSFQKEENKKSCQTIDDCNLGFNCLNGFCEKENLRFDCNNNDSNCPLNYVCNQSGICIEKLCDNSEDCENGFICFSNKCVVDSSNTDCRVNDSCDDGYKCDELSGKCRIDQTCSSNNDCEIGFDCLGNSCIEKTSCIADNHGSECFDDEFCNDDGFCELDAGCTNDNYCMNKDATKPACNLNSGSCYECIGDSYCEDGYICSNNTCHIEEVHTCTVDSDCSINKKCEDGECVPFFGSECETNADCTDSINKICSQDIGFKKCVECNADEHCATRQTCNLDYFICEDIPEDACLSDDECDVLENEICVDMECVPHPRSCDRSSDCNAANNEVCIVGLCEVRTRCDYTHSCSDGLECYRAIGEDFSYCVVPSVVGNLCDNSYPCQEGLICFYDIAVYNYICIAPAKVGESCAHLRPCEDQLACIYDYDVHDYTCVIPAKVGESCEDSYPCAETLDCDFDYDANGYICRQLGSLGDTCEWSDDCLSGLYCDMTDKVCRP